MIKLVNVHALSSDIRPSRSSLATLRANSFLLCLCSPVLHRMLCGSFIESTDKKVAIEDVGRKAFGKAMDMWCGRLNDVEMALDEVKVLAGVADRFQMAELASALDEAL